MQRVMRAGMDGIGQVVRAPLLIALVLIISMASVIPFAVVLRSQLDDALARQAPVDLGSGEIDADWWSEFRSRADGLAATFTPAVLGFAAPLDNLSGVLDGTRRPMILVIPVGLALVTWAWMWGVALQRFHLRRGLSIGEAISAGATHFPRLLAIGVLAAMVQLLLYLTVHRLLFGPVYGALATPLTPEPTAFAIRAALYIVFGCCIVPVSLLADDARVAQVVERPTSVAATMAAAATFLRRHLVQVAGLYLLVGLVFVAMTVSYGVLDAYGGSRVGGWRGIAIGQAFIIGRLSIRLLFGASELALFKSLRA